MKVYTGMEQVEFLAVEIDKQQFTLKLRLNEKVVGCTKLGKTQRMIGLLCYELYSL